MEDENYYTESDDEHETAVYENNQWIAYEYSDKFILDSDPDDIPILYSKAGIYSYMINNKLTNSQIIMFLEKIIKYEYNNSDLYLINDILKHKIDTDKLDIISQFLTNLKEKEEERIFNMQKYVDVKLVTKHRTLENITNPDMIRLIKSYSDDPRTEIAEIEQIKNILEKLNERIEGITFLQSLINEKIYRPEGEYECIIS